MQHLDEELRMMGCRPQEYSGKKCVRQEIAHAKVFRCAIPGPVQEIVRK